MPTFEEAANSVSKEDNRLIIDLVKAFHVYQRDKYQVNVDLTETMMDLTMVHGGGCPLDLQRMLDDFESGNTSSVGHDINGIGRHLDRDSGELTSCFWPRYARSQ